MLNDMNKLIVRKATRMRQTKTEYFFNDLLRTILMNIYFWLPFRIKIYILCTHHHVFCVYFETFSFQVTGKGCRIYIMGV